MRIKWGNNSKEFTVPVEVMLSKKFTVITPGLQKWVKVLDTRFAEFSGKKGMPSDKVQVPHVATTLTRIIKGYALPFP